MAHLADAIVANIIHSVRARRQRERRRLQELLTIAHKRCEEDVDMEEAIPALLREVCPSTTVDIHRTTEEQITLDGGTVFRTAELENGLWEDCEYFDYMIEALNNQAMVAPRVVRVISSQCASQRIPTFLLVGSKDFRIVFDDVDSWFVSMCATILCRYWQNRALKEAIAAKETFLRGITHQLRTPIHGILGSTELLTEELKARDIISATRSSSPSATPDIELLDPYTYLRTIRTFARELIGTVNNLIKLNQWAKIAQAERLIALHNISNIEKALLNDTMLAVPDDFSKRPSIIFFHHFPPNCDTFAIDIRLFLDCIQPLIVNAVQNTTSGIVVVTISLTEDYSLLIVDVEDDGNGISPENHQRIFNAYEKSICIL